MIYKRAESKFYWVRIEKKDHDLVQRSTKCVLKRDALQEEARIRLEEFGPDSPTFATTLTEFWPELKSYWERSCGERTFKYYKESLAPVLAFAPIATCQLHHVKQPLVEKFYAARQSQGLAVATMNHSIRALRRALHVAAEKFGYIAGAPKLTLLTGENQRDAVVSEADFQRLLKASGWTTQCEEGSPVVATVPPTTIRALLTVMFDCGLRAGEACRLEWSNVNLAEKWLFIESGKTKQARRRVGLTARAVTALTALRALRPDARFCFSRHDRTTPLTVGWVSHKFMRTRKALKMADGVVLHSLRHSCATRLGNAGANVLDLQKVMGWSSPTIASRYVHLDDDRMQTLAGLLEPGGKPLQ